MFTGTDILVLGRLANLSLIGIWTILTVRIMSKKRPRLWYLYTLNGHIISFGVGFAYYSQHGSPEPQRNNKLKFPRLMFYNGFYLETEKQQKLFSYEDI